LEARRRLLGLIPEAARTSPILGIGTNNVGFKFYDAMHLDEARLSSTNNTYLDLWLETGGLGLSAFVVLLAGAMLVSWRRAARARATPEGAVLLGVCLGLGGLALHLTNWSGWREAHVWLALGLAYACAKSLYPVDNERRIEL
jgi:O-antigen ligase